MNLPETAAQRMQQKTDYQSMVGACMMVTKCVGVTGTSHFAPLASAGPNPGLVWDFTDQCVVPMCSTRRCGTDRANQVLLGPVDLRWTRRWVLQCIRFGAIC